MLFVILLAGLISGSKCLTEEEATAYANTIFCGDDYKMGIQMHMLDPALLGDFTAVTQDGQNSPVIFQEGIREGLSIVKLIKCDEPRWYSANISFNCWIKFPLLKYSYNVTLIRQDYKILSKASANYTDLSMGLHLTSAPMHGYHMPHLAYMTDVEGTENVTYGIPEVLSPAKDAFSRHVDRDLDSLPHARFLDMLRMTVMQKPFPINIEQP